MGRTGWFAATVAAGVMLAPTAMAQEGREGSGEFVRQVLESYSDKPDVRPLTDTDPQGVWSPHMLELMRRDQALAGDEVPYLDGDPVCGCQDWEHLTVRSIQVTRNAGQRVVVTARFMNAGKETTRVFLMLGNPFRWRIDDVLNPGQPSLADQLEASNARLEAERRR